MARDGAHWRADGARNFPKGARMFNKSAQARMARLARDLANSNKSSNSFILQMLCYVICLANSMLTFDIIAPNRELLNLLKALLKRLSVHKCALFPNHLSHKYG